MVVQEENVKAAAAKSKKKKGGRAAAADDDDDVPQELLQKPREYTVRFIFPNPPPLNPPILGAYGKCYNSYLSHSHANTSSHKHTHVHTCLQTAGGDPAICSACFRCYLEHTHIC